MPDRDLTRALADATRDRETHQGEIAQIFSAVYDELRALARRQMGRERADHTLQPTALVNEAYLRLVDDSRLGWESRAHFFGIAARAMRQVLIDHARRRNSAKRGGGWERLRLETRELVSPEDGVPAIDLERTLTRLHELHPRSAEVVELRVFAGLSGAEIGSLLGVSRKTVVGDWRFACMWLGSALSDQESRPAHEAKD